MAAAIRFLVHGAGLARHSDWLRRGLGARGPVRRQTSIGFGLRRRPMPGAPVALLPPPEPHRSEVRARERREGSSSASTTAAGRLGLEVSLDHGGGLDVGRWCDGAGLVGASLSLAQQHGGRLLRRLLGRPTRLRLGSLPLLVLAP